MRIGTGYDVHRLTAGRPLIMGGVQIPFDLGLDGHSDADVLAHAVSDALLGALALGDIGSHFPDTDPRYAGSDSMILLAKVHDLIRENGYRIGNIDSTIRAQQPKLRPYIDNMRENLARTLHIPVDRISVKATTEEGLGFTGELKGISAEAVCLLFPLE